MEMLRKQMDTPRHSRGESSLWIHWILGYILSPPCCNCVPLGRLFSFRSLQIGDNKTLT